MEQAKYRGQKFVQKLKTEINFNLMWLLLAKTLFVKARNLRKRFLPHQISNIVK